MMRVCIVFVMVTFVGAARLAVEVHSSADTSDERELAEEHTNWSASSSFPIPLQAGCQPCIKIWTDAKPKGNWSLVAHPYPLLIKFTHWYSSTRRSVIPDKYLSGWIGDTYDTRDDNSFYAFSTVPGQGNYRLWSLEEGERGGTYRLKMAYPPGHAGNKEEPADTPATSSAHNGWYLASDATNERDLRNRDSNYVIITRHAREANHWQFECGDQEGWYFIRLANANGNQPEGWYLSQHNTEMLDGSHSHGYYFIVHAGKRWANQYRFVDNPVVNRSIVSNCEE